ncbi:MAG: hypothetical protein V1707_02305 [bacterium]
MNKLQFTIENPLHDDLYPILIALAGMLNSQASTLSLIAGSTRIKPVQCKVVDVNGTLSLSVKRNVQGIPAEDYVFKEEIQNGEEWIPIVVQWAKTAIEVWELGIEVQETRDSIKFLSPMSDTVYVITYDWGVMKLRF